MLVLTGASSGAYETDQYSHRGILIRDCRPELNRIVNESLAKIAAEWRGPADPRAFAHAVYRDLGGVYWVDRIERIAMKSPAVEHLPQYRHQSVFAGASFWARRVNFVFGVGRTIRLAGSLVGSDKLGHFFSQGMKYHRSYLDGWSEERILGRGRFNERWLFGQLTTSVYSNADLVANYEGYLFYRGLFEDGIVGDKPAIVRFREDGAAIRRPFDWADHVNDYWDEALHPSFMSPALARSIRQALLVFCDDYRRSPELYAIHDEAELRVRYAGIGLRPAPENGIPAVCAAAAANTATAGPAE